MVTSRLIRPETNVERDEQSICDAVDRQTSEVHDRRPLADDVITE